jgi:hypothetical protein
MTDLNIFSEKQFSDNTLISKALSLAKSRRHSRVDKLTEFDDSFNDIFAKNVDLLLDMNSDDWPLLNRLKNRATNDRALNVADPIFIIFLRCFHDLIIFEAEPRHIGACRNLIRQIQRWEPDERFIIGEARKGLSLVSSLASDVAQELLGMYTHLYLLS